MRYLAIDYGARRLGLAVCDESETLASPHGALTRQNLKLDLAALLQTVRGLNIEGLVFGLPRSTNASQVGDSESAARDFASRLESALQSENLALEIAWQDERFSTREALNAMKSAGISQKRGRESLGSDNTDARSAAIILQSFLDAKHARQNDIANNRVLESRADEPSSIVKNEPKDLFA